MANRVLLCCALILTTFYLSGSHGQTIKEVLDVVPEDELNDFIKFHLQKGYEQETYPHIYNKNFEKFSVKLYKCITENIILRDGDSCNCECCILFPTGCVAYCDPGVHPTKLILDDAVLTSCN